MSEYGQEFDNLQPHEQHAFLRATSPEYAKLPGQDQARFLAHARGEVMPQDRTADTPANKIFMGVDKPLDLKRYAVDRAAAVASVPTVGMGPLAGAAVRTGIQAGAGAIEGGLEHPYQGLIRGGINAGLEALPYGAGAAIRNTPGIKGWLGRREAAKAAAAQGAENESVAQTNKSAQQAFKDSERQRSAETSAGTKQDRQLFDLGESNRKDAATRAAQAENGLRGIEYQQGVDTAKGNAASANRTAFDEWMKGKQSAQETADVANRMAAWSTKGRNAAGKADAQAKADEVNRQTGERVRGVMQDQVPAQPLGSRGQVQDFGYGEQGLRAIKDTLDSGQAQIVKQLGNNQLRVTSLGKPGEATMPFEEAWQRAGQLRGPARDQAFDEIYQELHRLNPGGGAAGMFTQLRDVYNAAKVHQGVAKKLVEPTGGEYNIGALADWLNKRRDVILRRLGPDRTEALNQAIFRRPVGGGDPVAQPNFTPSPMPAKLDPMIPPKPTPIAPVLPERPARVSPAFDPRTPPEPRMFLPGTAPDKLQPQTITPDAQLVDTPGFISALARRIPGVQYLGPGKMWQGDKLPAAMDSPQRMMINQWLQGMMHQQ